MLALLETWNTLHLDRIDHSRVEPAHLTVPQFWSSRSCMLSGGGFSPSRDRQRRRCRSRGCRRGGRTRCDEVTRPREHGVGARPVRRSRVPLAQVIASSAVAELAAASPEALRPGPVVGLEVLPKVVAGQVVAQLAAALVALVGARAVGLCPFPSRRGTRARCTRTRRRADGGSSSLGLPERDRLGKGMSEGLVASRHGRRGACRRGLLRSRHGRGGACRRVLLRSRHGRTCRRGLLRSGHG
jgi:hypothetical protein